MNSWVEKAKQEAAARIPEIVFPTTKNENFKYTSVNEFKNLAFAPGTISSDVTDADISLEERESLCFPVQANRFPMSVQPDSSKLVVMDLRQAVVEYESLLKNKLGLASSFREDLFATLAASHWQAGTFIYVPRNVKASQDVVRAMQNFQAKNECQRIIIVLEQGAELAFASELISSNTCAFADVLVDIFLAENAILDIAQIQSLHTSTAFMIRCQATLEENANLQFAGIQHGGLKGQSRYNVNLQKPNATVNMQSAAFAAKQQHFDFWIDVHHESPHTFSQIDHYNILRDKAKSIFNGTLNVMQNAIKSEAYQLNKNLLLSDTATVHSLPKLEILVDDIKCAHGSSTSSISADQLFYFQSRGISANQAEQLLIRAFAAPVFAKLRSESFRDRLQQAVDKKILGKALR